jgi:hypothetical protein
MRNTAGKANVNPKVEAAKASLAEREQKMRHDEAVANGSKVKATKRKSASSSNGTNGSSTSKPKRKTPLQLFADPHFKELELKMAVWQSKPHDGAMRLVVYHHLPSF